MRRWRTIDPSLRELSSQTRGSQSSYLFRNIHIHINASCCQHQPGPQPRHQSDRDAAGVQTNVAALNAAKVEKQVCSASAAGPKPQRTRLLRWPAGPTAPPRRKWSVRACISVPKQLLSVTQKIWVDFDVRHGMIRKTRHYEAQTALHMVMVFTTPG